MKKIIALFLGFGFMLSIVLPASAVENVTEIEQEKINIQDFVKTQEDGPNTIQVIGKGDCARLKASVEKQSETDDKQEIIVSLFESLGIKLPKTHDSQIVSHFDEIESIELGTQYQKTDSSNENVEILSKDEMAQELSQSIVPYAAGNHQGEITDENGYMRQTIVALYIGKQEYKGNSNTPTYIIASTNEWLKKPANLLKDAFSLYCKDTLTPNEDLSRHEAYAYIEEYFPSTNGSREIEKPLNVQLQPEGTSAEWQLTPYINVEGVIRRNLSTTLMGTYHVNDTDGNNKLVTIWSKYIHSILGISISFGWDLGAKYPGVSFGPTVTGKEYGFKLPDFWTSGDYK